MGVLTKLFKMLNVFLLLSTLVAASPIAQASDASIQKPQKPCEVTECKGLDAVCEFFGLDDYTCHLFKCGSPMCLTCMGDCPPHGNRTFDDVHIMAALENVAHIEKPRKECFFLCTPDGCVNQCDIDDATAQAAMANGTLIIDSNDVNGTFQVASRRHPPASCYSCNPFLGICYNRPHCKFSGDGADIKAIDNSNECRRVCNNDGSVCAMICGPILTKKCDSTGFCFKECNAGLCWPVGACSPLAPPRAPLHAPPPAADKRDATGLCHQQCDADKCWIVCAPPIEE